MKNHTTTNIGLWIDHRQAVVVWDNKPEDNCEVILSHADRQPSRKEGKKFTGSYEERLVPDEDTKDRRFAQQLQHFYDATIDRVHEATSLFVFGPGEAKGEFLQRLHQKFPGPRHIHEETADKLTNPQIIAKVRDHFRMALI